MLIESNMTKGFWAEAVYAAADIINVLPNRANENNSPDELWFDEKPDLEMFKVFGCKAMVLVPKEKRRKPDDKSVECIFLRKANDAKAYRLFNRTTRKIVISRDVIFFENDFQMVNGNEKTAVFLPFSDGNDEIILNNNLNADPGESDQDESIIRDGIVEISSAESSENHSDENDSSASSEYLETTADDLDNSIADPTYRTRAIVPENAERPGTRSLPFNLLNYHVAFMLGEPQTYEQAVGGNDKEEWIVAMNEEFDSFIKNRTWILVDRPKDQRVVDNKWVFKVKKNPDDSIDRFKARLVARGFTQEYGVNYFETFSPVVRFTSIRIILAIASSRKMYLKQFDVKTAFLNGELDEEVFMEQPVGFKDGSNKVC